MIAENLACVYSSSDRRRTLEVVEELCRIGIAAVFVPSERDLGTWQAEVPGCDAVRARLVVEGVAVY